MNEVTEFVLQYSESTHTSLFFHIVSSHTETLVAFDELWNFAIVQFGRLQPKPTYNSGFRLFIIVKALRAKPLLHVHEEMVIARHQIRAVKRVIQYFPLELSQFGRSTSHCMRVGIVMAGKSPESSMCHNVSLNGPSQVIVTISVNCGISLQELH